MEGCCASKAAGPVLRVAPTLTLRDRLGHLAVRLSIRRMAYAVPPGLYALGNPGPDSPVFVSANYKLSFDILRRELRGRDCWILVLDTKGINVWCAAGKGTFGTDEIVRRVEAARLASVVSHRRLIVPQLGAPGVAAHDVLKRSGFRVVYGPVRARDLPDFLDAGLKATPEMRRVRFDLADRLILVPVEIVQGARWALLAAGALVLLAGLGSRGYDTGRAAADGGRVALWVFGALLAGGVLGPSLLPWLPGRAFATKGGILGAAVAGIGAALGWIPFAGRPIEAAAVLLAVPAIASFAAMNFTGASTYTSLSGVLREMRVAVPAQAVAGGAGFILWIVSRFVG